MAMGDIFGNLKQKVRSIYNNFFYDGAEAPAPQAPQQQEMYAPEQPYVQQAFQGYGQMQNQAPYAPQMEYQQQAYQQPQPFQQPQAQPQRNRRAQQHNGQQEGVVVDFGAYQQQYHQQAYQQSAPQPAPQSFQQPAPQAEAPVQQPNVAANARVINARGMADCRSAITLLRNGDAVLIVLENVTDPAELRRLVDTLSGACYSLTATITKVSRYGVYLLAPQTMAVYADQTTNQMNNPGRAAARSSYQPGFAAQRNYQPQQTANPYAQQQGFTQRPAQMEEPQQPFYARTAPQAAQVPSFSAQPAGYGYVADEMEAAVDQ